MAAARTETADARPLGIVGINEPQERVYRWLLANPAASAADLAEALSLSPDVTKRLLGAIEAKGLATHTPERPRRYIPVSPDIAVEALALKRQNELQQVRHEIQALQAQAAAAQRYDRREHMVELITSRAAEHQIVEQMTRTAQHEVVALVRPPMRINHLDVPADLEHSTQREAQARGVKSRSIVDSEFLALAGALDTVRSDVMAGEEVRVVPFLPSKMVLTDRRIAIIPLNLQRPDSPSLLVRSSALLDALYTLFEVFWERGATIPFKPAGSLKPSDPELNLPEGAEDLISLMSAGLNDKRIAYEMGISASTLKRRISEIMKAFNVRTRFQLGRLTAKH